jgi:hypothetical protein
VEVTGMQRFYSPRHDAIHFPLRCEEGFRSSLDDRHDLRYSFPSNLFFLHDFIFPLLLEKHWTCL